MEKLEYKGFTGSYRYENDEKEFYGKLSGITDLITFKGKNQSQVEDNFKEAVDDYIDLCNKIGKTY